MSDAAKDAAAGAAATGTALIAAAAGASPLMAALATMVPAVVEQGFHAIAKIRDWRTKRVAQVLIESDEDPEGFAGELNAKLLSENEDAIAAFRALMVATLEAVSPAALEPIAHVGRQYLRERCPKWIARSWLRVLTELDDGEIAALREAVEAGRNFPTIERIPPTGPPRVIPSVGPHVYFGLSHPSEPESFFYIRSLLAREGPEGHAETVLPQGKRLATRNAGRLCDLLVRHNLGILDERDPQFPSPPGFKAKPRERVFAFDDASFLVISNAFP